MTALDGSVESSPTQEETFSAKASFYYMKEGHYYRTLAVGGESYPDGGGVAKNDPNFQTVNDVWDAGIDGLVKKIHMVLLGLPFWNFETEFGVYYIPEGKERYSDQILVGGIDIADKDAATVIGIVRDLVNKKLTEEIAEVA